MYAVSSVSSSSLLPPANNKQITTTVNGNGNSKPLSGTVVCLTGFDPPTKDRWHSIIVNELGGAYARDLDVHRITHLVVDSKNSECRTSAKYTTALKHQHVLKLVTEDWLMACHEQECRVSEDAYCATVLKKQQPPAMTEEEQRNNEGGDLKRRRISTEANDNRSTSSSTTEERLEQALLQSKNENNASLLNQRRLLFSDCHFAWLLPDDNDDDDKCDDVNNKMTSKISSSADLKPPVKSEPPEETEHAGTGVDGNNNINCDNNNNNNKKRKTSAPMIRIRAPLERLIRRGMGTMCWDINNDHDMVTHVLIPPNCWSKDELRRKKQQMTATQSTFLSFVSPDWILASWQAVEHVNSKNYPPILKEVKTIVATVATNDTKNSAVAKKKQSNVNMHSATNRNRSLFRGALFACLRVSPPPNAVDYNEDALLTEIQHCGGQILCLKLIQALQADHQYRNRGGSSNNNTVPQQQRTCYVLCWGGQIVSNESHYVRTHPLLAQLTKNNNLNCRVVLTTPLWLHTCLKERRVVQISIRGALTSCKLPPSEQSQSKENNERSLEESSATGKEIITPTVSAAQQLKSHHSQPWYHSLWPWVRLDKSVRISVSGFVGSERTALEGWITALGATLDCSMRKATTHLIVVQGSKMTTTSSKYEKALEWRIQVVTRAWLEHVAQYGLSGVSQNKIGCEDQFRPADTESAGDGR